MNIEAVHIHLWLIKAFAALGAAFFGFFPGFFPATFLAKIFVAGKAWSLH